MLDIPWDHDVMSLSPCLPKTDPKLAPSHQNFMFFAGPRVRMGIYEGKPIRVVPHTTSGRADYFGPFVNRCMLNTHLKVQSRMKLGIASATGTAPHA